MIKVLRLFYFMEKFNETERMIPLADKTDFYVGGYRFASLGDAGQAKQEQKKAAYFEDKLTGRSAQDMLAVYDKILDEKVFQTPAGWEYLKKLQEELRRAGIQEGAIRPIPMYVMFTHDNDDETPVRVRIKPAKKKDTGRALFRTSVFINLFLAVLVIAMFVISLSSSNPNILNYKNVLENQYASWEQELTKREKSLRQKEALLEEGGEAQEDQMQGLDD